MKYFSNIGIGKKRFERRKTTGLKRVNQKTRARGCDLNQADFFLIVKQGISFKINAHDVFVFQDASSFFKVLKGRNKLMLYFNKLMNRLFPFRNIL